MGLKKRKKRVTKKTAIPKPAHQYGYTWKEIRNFMTVAEMKRFGPWMGGQTCAVDEKTGEILYYPYDVRRFLDMVRKGIPTLWD